MSAAETIRAVIRERRSIRRFRDEAVPGDLIERLVELASWAPSAGNRQDWLFTAVTSGPIKSAMTAVVNARWKEIAGENQGSGVMEEVGRYAGKFVGFEAAPLVIAVSARAPNALQRRLLGENAWMAAGGAASAAMAAQNLMLGAHALGLGSCCMTGALAAQDELKRVLGLGRREEIICLVKLGWPSETPAPPARKPVRQLLRRLE